MIKQIIKEFLPAWYICEPAEWIEADQPHARLKIWAWSPGSARIKAFAILQCENIRVYRYE